MTSSYQNQNNFVTIKIILVKINWMLIIFESIVAPNGKSTAIHVKIDGY
jgi:hypothetical protein